MRGEKSLIGSVRKKILRLAEEKEPLLETAAGCVAWPELLKAMNLTADSQPFLTHKT